MGDVSTVETNFTGNYFLTHLFFKTPSPKASAWVWLVPSQRKEWGNLT